LQPSHAAFGYECPTVIAQPILNGVIGIAVETQLLGDPLYFTTNCIGVIALGHTLPDDLFKSHSGDQPIAAIPEEAAVAGVAHYQALGVVIDGEAFRDALNRIA
jgi:hypothetical protein